MDGRKRIREKEMLQKKQSMFDNEMDQEGG